MNLSITIPAYNEEKRIGPTLKEYTTFFRKLKRQKQLDFEIIVVLNDCRDNTLSIVKEFEKKFKEIRHLEFKRSGKGFAITEGFRDALKRKNDLIGFVDSDMSTSPETFYDLIVNINDNDGVIANRYDKNSIIYPKQQLMRRIVSRTGNLIIRTLFLFPYKDTQCGAKLFRKNVIQKLVDIIDLTEWAYDVNLLYLCRKYNFKIIDIPTKWENKEGSMLKINRVPLQFLLGVIRLRIIHSKIEPLARQLRFIAYLGDKIINK